MTDAELIARLRAVCTCNIDSTPCMAEDDCRDALAAADRIEALTKERDDYAHKLMQANNTYTEMHLEIEQLSDKLATCEKYRDAYAECDRIGTQAVRDLEAKLEHAKKGLRKILRTSDRNSAWDIAIATLEKLKGESHD